jgi:hypothetical protein
MLFSTTESERSPQINQSIPWKYTEARKCNIFILDL